MAVDNPSPRKTHASPQAPPLKSLHRPDGAAPFEQADAQLLQSLLPHLRRAMQLRHQLAAAASPRWPGLDALDALAMGVLVVDEHLAATRGTYNGAVEVGEDLMSIEIAEGGQTAVRRRAAKR